MYSLYFVLGNLLLPILASFASPEKLDYYGLMARCQEDRCRKSREYSAILGHASWTLLHTLTVNYPDDPTDQDKSDINQFFHLFGKFYPCKLCSKNFVKELAKFPPRVESRQEISVWLCELHNSVNERLGKPIFDCSRVFEQWQRDPADGYCPDVCPVSFGDDSDIAEEAAVSYIAVDSAKL